MLRPLPIFVVACALVGTVFFTPTQSHAFFGLFKHCHGGRPTTYYPPPPSAPCCTPCAPQRVNYVPQTCYRTVCQNVPVTTYRPVTTCDPCTGCPVTCMRPVTSYVRQVRYVPYTTYRRVVTPVCAPASCAPVQYGPTAVMTTPTAPNDDCCTPSYTPSPPPQRMPQDTPRPSLNSAPPESTYRQRPKPEPDLGPNDEIDADLGTSLRPVPSGSGSNQNMSHQPPEFPGMDRSTKRSPRHVFGNRQIVQTSANLRRDRRTVPPTAVTLTTHDQAVHDARGWQPAR